MMKSMWFHFVYLTVCSLTTLGNSSTSLLQSSGCARQSLPCHLCIMYIAMLSCHLPGQRKWPLVGQPCQGPPELAAYCCIFLGSLPLPSQKPGTLPAESSEQNALQSWLKSQLENALAGSLGWSGLVAPGQTQHGKCRHLTSILSQNSRYYEHIHQGPAHTAQI